MRRQFDGERDFFRRKPLRHGFEGDVNGGESHAQPAVLFIVPQQHHRGLSGAGKVGEEFRLADKTFVAGADDGFLVHRGGDEGVQFATQAAGRALAQGVHGGLCGGRRTGGQRRWQQGGGRIENKKTAGRVIARKRPKVQPGGGIGAQGELRVADKQVFGPVGTGFGGHGFQGHFRAHARHVPQRNANPAGHSRQGPSQLNTRCGYW